MLVYGDVECVEAVGNKRKEIERHLDEMEALLPGIARHAALVTAFIGTSELVQGLVDADFEAHGFDANSAVHLRGMECLSSLACCVVESWRSGLARTSSPDHVRDRLRGLPHERSIRIRQAEGYAFYALYPESYVEAAVASGLGPATRVIGIRSIGAGLGALVAAALKAPPAFTVRPVGHPFRREVHVHPATTEMAAPSAQLRIGWKPPALPPIASTSSRAMQDISARRPVPNAASAGTGHRVISPAWMTSS